MTLLNITWLRKEFLHKKSKKSDMEALPRQLGAVITNIDDLDSASLGKAAKVDEEKSENLI